LKHEKITEEQQVTAALYALGALSQQEASSFETHLRGEDCLVCRTTEHEFEMVAASLGSSVTEASPAPYLRDILTARIEREAQTAPEKAGGSVINFPERSTVTIPAAESPARAFWQTALPWALAASFLIAFAIALLGWRSDRQELQARIDSTRLDETSALKDNVELRDKLKRESARTDELNQINSVVASGQWRMITLAGQEPAPSAVAKVYWDTKNNRWVVTADLPAAPAGKVYQLWFVTPDAKISAGLIDSDQNGHGFAVARVPSNITNLSAAAITLEPEGGSTQPTMPIYALGKV
jgi:anti-sigma-K factor RskA